MLSNTASASTRRPQITSPNQLPLTYMEDQELGPLPERYEIRRDSQDRAYYVDHELEVTSYQHAILLVEMKNRSTSGHETLIVDTTNDGREYLVNYNSPGLIGPLPHGHGGVYAGKRLELEGNEYKIILSENLVFGIFPTTDNVVWAGSAADEVQIEVVVFDVAKL